MGYEQLFVEIANPNNKVQKHVISMKGGIENVKYSVRSEKGKLLFYVLGSDFDEFAPAWVVKKLVVNDNKEAYFSVEQVVAVFTAVSDRYVREMATKEVVSQNNLRVR